VKLGLSDQPVAYSAAFKAVLAMLVVLGAVTLSGEQVASMSVAFDAVLGVFVFAAVTPKKTVGTKVATAATHARLEALADVASLTAKPKPAPRKPPAAAKKGPRR
jgi:hypothetical protein